MHAYYPAQVTGFLKENYAPEVIDRNIWSLPFVLIMEKTAEESWRLNNVAVLPEFQRNGIATSLLDEVLKKVG